MANEEHPDGLNTRIPRWVPYTALILSVAVAWFWAGEGGIRFATEADHTDQRQVMRGKQIYEQHCARCHGVQLEGEPNWKTAKADGTLPAPPHDASGHTWHHTDKQNFAYTKYGAAGIGAPASFKSGMPAFEGVLSDAQIWDALAFIESTWPDDIHQRRPEP